MKFKVGDRVILSKVPEKIKHIYNENSLGKTFIVTKFRSFEFRIVLRPVDSSEIEYYADADFLELEAVSINQRLLKKAMGIIDEV